jgi:hypothetical protein
MADRVLFISWGTVVRGREERALEVFNDLLGMYGRMQQEGRIERFDVVLLEPNGRIGGYFELHGSVAQLDALREDEEFQRELVDSDLVVDDLRVVLGSTNTRLAQNVQLYQERIAALPQRV